MNSMAFKCFLRKVDFRRPIAQVLFEWNAAYAVLQMVNRCSLGNGQIMLNVQGKVKRNYLFKQIMHKARREASGTNI